MTAVFDRWRSEPRGAIADGAIAPRRFGAAEWALIGVIVAGGLLRIAALMRPGYSLDEEITYFAVQGIRRHGLPLFPSGVLSERGLPFSYAAWAAGFLFGHDVPS